MTDASVIYRTMQPEDEEAVFDLLFVDVTQPKADGPESGWGR